MNERVESLLAELTLRYGISPDFAAKLRPCVERILDPALAEGARVHLLEILAETAEREIQIRRQTEPALAALTRLSAHIEHLVQLLASLRKSA